MRHFVTNLETEANVLPNLDFWIYGKGMKEFRKECPCIILIHLVVQDGTLDGEKHLSGVNCDILSKKQRIENYEMTFNASSVYLEMTIDVLREDPMELH